MDIKELLAEKELLRNPELSNELAKEFTYVIDNIIARLGSDEQNAPSLELVSRAKKELEEYINRKGYADIVIFAFTAMTDVLKAGYITGICEASTIQTHLELLESLKNFDEYSESRFRSWYAYFQNYVEGILDSAARDYSEEL